jgi:tetratricopeptide (TPR) repeat protein
LLDIPLPAEQATTLSPEEFRRRQLAALTNWIMASAKTQPVVLVFEDLHWADPTTLDVLRSIAERGAPVPLYIVATTRPEFRPPWGMRSHHGTISLAPLDGAEVREMVAELSARYALARDVVDDVAARSGGVPLFVEEVTRLLLEREEQGGAQAIPPTLQQSLMARLDRLGSAREVAQIGSVIGRGFSYKLLKAVANMDDGSLEAALQKLSDADIVLVDGVLPDSDYRFKHALIQDAAYENLLKTRRQVLHGRIAETLLHRFADKAAAEPEPLAHHFTQAGLTEAAVEWWGKAGDQALRRSAFQEAIAHLSKAIEMAERAAQGASAPSTISQRLKLQTNLGRAVMWSKGFGSAETQAVYARARELATNVDDPAEHFATYYGEWLNTAMRAGHAAARDIPERLLRQVGTDIRTPEVATALRSVGLTLHMKGDFVEAKRRLEEALWNYDATWSRDEKFRIGLEPGLTTMAYLANTEWVLGNVERSRNLITEATALAIEAGHVPTLGSAYSFAAQLEVLRGDSAACLNAAKTAAEYTRANDLGGIYAAMPRVCLGWALARLGEGEAGAAELRKGVAAHTKSGNKAWTPLFQGLLAQIEAEVDVNIEALGRLTEALAFGDEISEHWVDSLLYRIRGEVLLRGDPANSAPAEDAFLTAIGIAQRQDAKSFRLQAALLLAQLYQSTGRPADARAILGPALEGFSPTPEFPEITNGQELLATLEKLN